MEQLRMAKPLATAAANAGMSEPTARKWRAHGKRPSVTPQEPRAPERRRVGRPQVCLGPSLGQHRLPAEATPEVRPGPRRDTVALAT